MIAFEEMDARLKDIGKDRAWLAEQTPYSAAYIRDVLAPSSTRKTERIQQILSEAIEKQQAQNETKLLLPDRITLDVSPETFENYNRAAVAKGLTIKEWMIEMINQAAQTSVESDKRSSGE